MGYNVTALPDFKTEGKAFVVKSLLEAETIKLLTAADSFDPTAKGSQTIQLLDNDVIVQDSGTAGRTPSGGAVLSQATLTVKGLKIEQDYNPRDLEKKWAKTELKAGQVYDEVAFMSEIADLNSKTTAVEIDKMIWHSDSTLTGDTSLKHFDGYIKQIKAGSYINLSGATGATTIAKLQKVYSLMPIEVRSKEDFRILIGKDTEDAINAELFERNLFNPAAPKEVPGTGAKYEVIHALNLGHVVATRLRSLQAGGEMTEVEFEQYYSRETKLNYLDSHFSLGVVPIRINEIGYVKFA
jgi:hypothetical protein